ncbi:MAG: sensor histidine kinase [Thermodesulfobacteriota bacterium]
MRLAELSIRKKITHGFGLLLLLVTCTALMTYGIVLQVERKVGMVAVIDDFLNTTLELRRYEKNYFLYGQEKDFDDAIHYWEQLKEQLENNAAELVPLISSSRLQGIREVLVAYRDDMGQFHAISRQYGKDGGPLADRHAGLQDAVRRNGKLLTSFAEETSLAERNAIKGLLYTTRSLLIGSTVVLMGIFLSMAVLLGRKLLGSLRLLEGYTKKIAHGEMLDPPDHAVEEEINTLFNAFQRMNRELRVRQRQLVQSEKLAALGTLLAGVAHELNNPLSNISTSAQILAEEIETGEMDFKKNLLRQIDTQTDKARDIVRSLLEFSRVKEFSREPVGLRSLLDDTMRLLRGQLAKGVAVELDVAEEIVILVDKQRMQQVFLNLLKNAADAIGESGHIWVSAQRTVAPGEPLIEIVIEDDGPGIAPEVVKKIFDPFFTTKDVGKGSGLGLFVVYDIVEAHGGHITVDSRPGNGTAFVIWLPDEKEKEKKVAA